MATTPVSMPEQQTPFKPSHFETLPHSCSLPSTHAPTSATAARQTQEEDLLETMLNKMVKSTTQANEALDDALAFIEQSDQRIAAMDANRHQQVA